MIERLWVTACIFAGVVGTIVFFGLNMMFILENKEHGHWGYATLIFTLFGPRYVMTWVHRWGLWVTTGRALDTY